MFFRQDFLSYGPGDYFLELVTAEAMCRTRTSPLLVQGAADIVVEFATLGILSGHRLAAVATESQAAQQKAAISPFGVDKFRRSFTD